MKLTFATLYHIIFPISFITSILSVLAALFSIYVEKQTTLAILIIFNEIIFLSSMLGLHIDLDIYLKSEHQGGKEVKDIGIGKKEEVKK